MAILTAVLYVVFCFGTMGFVAKLTLYDGQETLDRVISLIAVVLFGCFWPLAWAVCLVAGFCFACFVGGEKLAGLLD